MQPLCKENDMKKSRNEPSFAEIRETKIHRTAWRKRRPIDTFQFFRKFRKLESSSREIKGERERESGCVPGIRFRPGLQNPPVDLSQVLPSFQGRNTTLVKSKREKRGQREEERKKRAKDYGTPFSKRERVWKLDATSRKDRTDSCGELRPGSLLACVNRNPYLRLSFTDVSWPFDTGGPPLRLVRGKEIAKGGRRKKAAEATGQEFSSSPPSRPSPQPSLCNKCLVQAANAGYLYWSDFLWKLSREIYDTASWQLATEALDEGPWRISLRREKLREPRLHGMRCYDPSSGSTQRFTFNFFRLFTSICVVWTLLFLLTENYEKKSYRLCPSPRQRSIISPGFKYGVGECYGLTCWKDARLYVLISLSSKNSSDAVHSRVCIFARIVARIFARISGGSVGGRPGLNGSEKSGSQISSVWKGASFR